MASRISQRDVASFSRPLATLLTADVPLAQSLDVVADGTVGPTLKDLIHRVRDELRGRTSSRQRTAR